MKKIITLLALAAFLQTANVQAQVKSPAAAEKAVEKTYAATQNPKQNTKVATWINYGNALLDAYNACLGNVWTGMSLQDLQLIDNQNKALSESQVEINGTPMIKMEYPNHNLYFNADGKLAITEISKPIVEDCLEKAIAAFEEAGKIDSDGKKTKDIVLGINSVAEKFTNDAYTAYSFGKLSDASMLFEKSVQASAVAPLSKIDTSAIYNTAWTAWAANDNARAKTFFLRCEELGFEGENGDVFAKLSEIASKMGNEEESVAYLEKGFTKYPQSQGILVGLINYYIAKGDSTDRLFELLEGAKKNEPDNASLYYVEGNIHTKLSEYDAAIVAYDKCAEIDPNYAFGYIGKGVLYYNRAIELQDNASNEMDDAKYMALMGEFETTLKACIPCFEQAFELTQDNELKKSIAEYLKNACFRFRTESDEALAKYEKYAHFGE